MSSELKPSSPWGAGWRKLFAVLAFVAGGAMAELASPQHCIQIHVSRRDAGRRRRSQG